VWLLIVINGCKGELRKEEEVTLPPSLAKYWSASYLLSNPIVELERGGGFGIGW
jgi:hypothetical protein